MTARNALLAMCLAVVGCGESAAVSSGGVGPPDGSSGSAVNGGSSTDTGGSRSSGGRSGSPAGGTSGSLGSGGNAGAIGTGGVSGSASGGSGGRVSASTGGVAGLPDAGAIDAGPSPAEICQRLLVGADAGGGATDGAVTNVRGIDLTSDGIPRVTQAYVAFGASFRTSQSAPIPGCTTRSVGACSVTACVPYDQVDAGAAPDPDSPPYRHAGQLRVRNVVSDPDANGVYPGVSYFGQQGFKGGDQILYCALGGDVPAFAQYLVGPGHVRVETTGSFPWRDNPVFDRAMAHTVAWTAAGPGDVLLNISNTGFAGRTLPRVSVGCRFAASASPGTIPAAVWQDFPSGDASMSLRTTNSDAVVAGGYRVPISATYLGPSIRLTL